MEVREPDKEVFVEGSMSGDQAQALLAKANLLRLRGDASQAEEICLTVLTSHPTDVFALCMLGDIRFQQARAEEAEHLYDLAVGTGDAPTTVHERLQVLKARRALPSKPQNTDIPAWMIAGTISVVFICIAITAAIIAPKFQSSADAVTVRIVAPKDSPSEPTPVKPTDSPPTIRPKPMIALADAVLSQKIEQKSGFADRMISVQTDPRSATASITVALGPNEQPRDMASIVAIAAFNSDSALHAVSIRLVSDERIVFVGEVSRESFENAFKIAPRPSSDALANAFSNEWLNGRKASDGPTSKDRP